MPFGTMLSCVIYTLTTVTSLLLCTTYIGVDTRERTKGGKVSARRTGRAIE